MKYLLEDTIFILFLYEQLTSALLCYFVRFLLPFFFLKGTSHYVKIQLSPNSILWGYESGGAIPSGADQNCDGMPPDHSSGWTPDSRQQLTRVALVRR